jgi:hypothetical protein
VVRLPTHQLWGPTQIHNGYLGRFDQGYIGRRARKTTQLHLVLWLKMELQSSIALTPLGSAQGQLYCDCQLMGEFTTQKLFNDVVLNTQTVLCMRYLQTGSSEYSLDTVFGMSTRITKNSTRKPHFPPQIPIRYPDYQPETLLQSNSCCT